MSVQTEIERISQNVANTYAVLEAMGCEIPLKQDSDNLATTAGTSKVVRYDTQSLTNEQKEQVRKNINSASIEEVGRLQEIVNEKANKTDISSPYNFKGSTTYSALPTSGNTVNDTYYCTDMKCKYTWNGSAWYQSSLKESEYEEELSVLSVSIKDKNEKINQLGTFSRTANLFDKFDYSPNSYLSNDGNTTKDTSYFVSGYIDVSKYKGKILYFTVDAQLTPFRNACAYGANKEFLSFRDYGTNYTIPNDAEHIRLTIANTNLGKNIMLRDSTDTEYHEYYERPSIFDGLTVYNLSMAKPTGGINGTNVYTRSGARASIPNDIRKKGLIITYLTENGWMAEQYCHQTASWSGFDLYFQKFAQIKTAESQDFIGNKFVKTNTDGTISESDVSVETLEKVAKKPQVVMPKEYYVVVGHEFNIYNENIIVGDNVKDYVFEWSGYYGVYDQLNECFRITPIKTGDYTVSLFIHDAYNFDTLLRQDIVIHAIADTQHTNKKVLFIGDSLTNAGIYPSEIQYNLSKGGITSIGTITSTPFVGDVQKPINHEGRGGWSAYDYTTKSSDNAFWNPNTNAFDFSYYMNTNGYASVDVVFLNLGTNNVAKHTQEVEALNTMINSIKDFSSKIPIIVSLIPPSSEQDGWTASVHGGSRHFFKQRQMNLIKACIDAFDGKIDNVYVAPVYFNIDTHNDYDYEEVAVSARNPMKIKRQTNNVHLSKYGYLKIADVYYGVSQKVLN